MRCELGNERVVRASQVKRRVRFKPGDERVARMLPLPALVFIKCNRHQFLAPDLQMFKRGRIFTITALFATFPSHSFNMFFTPLDSSVEDGLRTSVLPSFLHKFQSEAFKPSLDAEA
jgi:hypothetical protein